MAGQISQVGFLLIIFFLNLCLFYFNFSQWKSDKKHRSRAMPHIKTYALYDKNYEKLNWFVLSSANISKAAWGQLRSPPIDCRVSLHILSYECGVLFLPKFIVS